MIETLPKARPFCLSMNKLYNYNVKDLNKGLHTLSFLVSGVFLLAFSILSHKQHLTPSLSLSEFYLKFALKSRRAFFLVQTIHSSSSIMQSNERVG